MSEVNVEQVNLLLKLYDMRREPKLREAREWFARNFHPQTIEDVMKICPPGSEGNAFMRQLLSYWEMVASIANRGVIDEDLFFETTGEFFFVWERIKPTIAEGREQWANKQFLANMERAAQRFEVWSEKHSPGHIDKMREFMKRRTLVTHPLQLDALAVPTQLISREVDSGLGSLGRGGHKVGSLV